MKSVTASEAQENWSGLLDEVAQGEVVLVVRNEKRFVLQAQDEDFEATATTTPSYRELLEVPEADEADRWSWEWAGPGQDLVAKTAPSASKRES